MSDMAMLRIGILVAGAILFAAIFFFGRPKKPSQGRRVEPSEHDNARVEPSLSADDATEHDYSDDAVTQPELGLAGGTPTSHFDSDLGKRLVTTGVGPLSADEIDAALAAGADAAEGMIGDGLILASGEVPRRTSYENGLPGHYTWRDGEATLDVEIRAASSAVTKPFGRRNLKSFASSVYGTTRCCAPSTSTQYGSSSA